jgi:hypothetical protein
MEAPPADLYECEEFASCEEKPGEYNIIARARPTSLPCRG